MVSADTTTLTDRKVTPTAVKFYQLTTTTAPLISCIPFTCIQGLFISLEYSSVCLVVEVFALFSLRPNFAQNEFNISFASTRSSSFHTILILSNKNAIGVNLLFDVTVFIFLSLYP